MLGPRRLWDQSDKYASRRRAVRPDLEGLEQRLLLYSTLGDQWTYDSRITFSFMPDATSVGGVPSVLFQTLNAIAATAAWQQQIEQAAALWENATNMNLALVSDGGQPVAVSGNQQDDPRFGDIRIGAVPLPSGVLAETFLPPPANGGTDAGDMILNSNANWQIGGNYDLMTVTAHEFGHSLGLGESTVSTAVMYGTYNGIKQALASDDIAGIQSIYGTRQFDQFNQNGHRNNTVMNATNINSYITASGQIAIPGLDITTTGAVEWFTVNVPSSTTGAMAVTAQSSNLSSLAPKLQVYNSSLSLIGSASAPGTLGATISVNVGGVQAGQQYYYRVSAAGGPGPIGGWGLLVNFGSQSQPQIPPPNTVVPQQPDQGGGTINYNPVKLTAIGTLSDWAVAFDASTPTPNLPGSDPVTTSPVLSGGGVTGDQATVAGSLVSPATAGVTIITTGSGSAPAQLALLPAASAPAPDLLQALDGALEQWASTKHTKHAFGLL
jgi:hypothetical protein